MGSSGNGTRLKVQFLGATGTVTGSRTLVTAGRTRILVDCGMYQGLKELRLRNRARFPIDPAKIDAVVLTHAHIDHSGIVPLLVKQGFEGKIYCTDASKRLCEVLLPDCAYIQEEDATYANKKGFSKHHPAEPLYTVKDAFESLKQFQKVPFNRETEIGDAKVTFFPAGHILGASHVRITSGKKSVLFSGDVGRYNDFLEVEPSCPPQSDLVVMESTYGDRKHPKDDIVKTMADLVSRVVARKGIMIIPAFAVGRAQMLLLALSRAFESGECPKIPVYVNSPMTTSVTALYKQFCGEHRLKGNECDDAFKIARFVTSVEESKQLNDRPGPMIIISASGMLTGGRVLHHVEVLGRDPKNLILLAGFQAAGTRGAALADGIRTLKMHGQFIDIQAEVIKLDMFSAHADQDELLRWVKAIQPTPTHVVLNHGEPKAQDSLKRVIQRSLTDCEVEIATEGQEIIL
jgi:metallo-beta-lactamase family protein